MASMIHRFSVSGRFGEAGRDQPQPDRDQHRDHELRAPAQAERTPPHHLRVVVGEAQQRARDRDAEDADRAPVHFGQQQERDRDRGEDDDPAHRRRAGLGVVPLGPLLADVLAELALAQERDELRRQEDADQQRGGPRDQDLTHGASASATVSRPIPREALTSTTSPGRDQLGRERGGLGRVGDDVRLAGERRRASPPTAGRRRRARQRRMTPRRPRSHDGRRARRARAPACPRARRRAALRAPAWRDRRARRAWRAGWRCSSR